MSWIKKIELSDPPIIANGIGSNPLALNSVAMLIDLILRKRESIRKIVIPYSASIYHSRLAMLLLGRTDLLSLITYINHRKKIMHNAWRSKISSEIIDPFHTKCFAPAISGALLNYINTRELSIRKVSS